MSAGIMVKKEPLPWGEVKAESFASSIHGATRLSESFQRGRPKEMKEQNISVEYTRSQLDTIPDETDWDRVDALTDEDISVATLSDEDDPETDEAFWKDAEVVLPENHVLVEPDVFIPTIIDNRRKNTLLDALEKLLPHATAMDIATGFFEIGSLLALNPLWQRLEHLRIIMGDETTRSTKAQIIRALELTENLENEKARDDTLEGLSAVRDAIAKQRIKIRVYIRAKFHAKTYLMEANESSSVDFAFVGSSNFTRPGLTHNVELNLSTTDQIRIQALRDWYDEVWDEAEDVSTPPLKSMPKRCKNTLLAERNFKMNGKQMTQ
jgi:hypothetical protein